MPNVATLPSLFHSINFQVSAHAELKPSLRKRIKAAGGDYSDVRGAYTNTNHHAVVEPTVTHDPTCIVPEVLAHLAANPQES